ncbi:MAG TPA: ERAP1-like C-terminal domain-containing protein, partial [Terriglobales bacterium]|nr:ERAP1-like C-terminal domain-containing protein [Terriglobales bacterium]
GMGSICVLMTRKEMTASASGCADWVFGNRDADGYYRVAYSREDLRKIGIAAEERLNVPERIALVEDSWAMTTSGNGEVSQFFELAQQLRGEKSLPVIDALWNHFDDVGDSLVASDQRQKYQELVRTQFGSAAREIGWQPRPADSDEQKALRTTLLQILGRAGDQEAIAVSRRLVQQYMQDPSSVDGTLIGSAFTVAAENGDDAFYARLAETLNSARSTDAYYHYLYALTNFRQPELLERTIGLLDQGKVRQQDYPRFLGALLENPASRAAAWKYLKEHWEDLAQKVTSFGGAGAISALGSACSVEMNAEVEGFFANHPAPGAQRAVQQSLERIKACASFKRDQQAHMRQWLERH